MGIMNKKIVSGPVIIEDGKILLIKDEDDFYKVPGGEVEVGENLEEACKREVKEEINGDIIILKKLSTLILDKHQKMGEPLIIELYHFLSKLKNRDIKPQGEVKEIKWIPIKDIKLKKYDVAPNIEFLIEKGDIK